MAYQVLARKWRPQDFQSVVGQGPVVQALRNGLKEGRIAQAYLFSGIRGIGKTSVARVLAKALNCETGPPPDPCNKCGTCEGIKNGSDLDVLEIDAATYSKVEQVRELTDSLRYGPAHDRYKVVIIDEIHRLSRQAFDALLKIVEEPPPHLVFIFATTESEAVPATILSRCQSFQFRRVPLAEMVAHLDKVARAEQIEVSETALHLIARAAEGSVRDAIALLDQLGTFGAGKIADDEVGRILGGVDLALFLELLAAIAAGDRDGVAAFVRRVEQSGWDPRHVYGQFLDYCRDALHLALDPPAPGSQGAGGGEGARVDLPSEEAAALAARAAEIGYENLLRLMHLFLDSELTVRRSESAGLALEVTLLRAAELPKLTAIEELLASGGGAAPSHSEPTGTPGRRRAGRSAAPSQGEPAPTLSEHAARRGAPPPDNGSEPATSPQEASSAPPWEPDEDEHDAGDDGQEVIAAAQASIGEGRELVTQLLERLSCMKQSLAAHLTGAQSLSLADGVLTICTVPGDSVLERTLQRPSNRDLLEETLAAMLGPTARWRIRAGASEAPAAPESLEDDGAASRVADDPTVQTVLDLFGGRIDRIEQRDATGKQGA